MECQPFYVADYGLASYLITQGYKRQGFTLAPNGSAEMVFIRTPDLVETVNKYRSGRGMVSAKMFNDTTRETVKLFKEKEAVLIDQHLNPHV